ncbi:MAG: MotA/TolQ/ExbB proton channel family protein [Treponema sp.]|jgi:biopolymer transport protein ExbB|nr:MotA/TolQ/ExbB proton channel family protein [Treponema sp.]
MEHFFAFIAFLDTGGPVNWLIAGLYVLVLALFSERFIYFFRTRYKKDAVFRALESGAVSPGTDRAMFPGVHRQSQPLRMALCFLRHQGEPESILQEILDREAAVIQAEMERGLGVLSVTGTVAPLLGLLGTITGLMSAFRQIAARGSAVDIGFLSGGIWEAMITTATGLVTAICALSCCKGCEHLSASRLRDMSFAVSILSEKLRRNQLSEGKPRSIQNSEESA